jgi:hypothetical protein
MRSIHNVRLCGLSLVVELANSRWVVEIHVEWRVILESMQLEQYLGWNRLGLGVVEPNVIDDESITAR